MTFLHVSTNSRMLSPLPVAALYSSVLSMSNFFFFATAMCASTKSTTWMKSRHVVPSLVEVFRAHDGEFIDILHRHGVAEAR